MSVESSAAAQPGPTSSASSTAEPDFSLALPQTFLETVEKFVAAPTDEAVSKPFQELLTKAKTQTIAKAEADKKAAEAAKNQPPPDYSKLTLPEGTKFKEAHLKSVVEFAKTAKLPVETAKAILDRDNEVLNAHMKGIEEEFKAYNDNAVKTLKADWGNDFEKNVGMANKVVEFYEKQMPGIKAEITRLGLSNSVTANKFFLQLFKDLKMAPDTIETGAPGQTGNPAERSQEAAAKALFKKSMAQAG
jgi:hypothetical protein